METERPQLYFFLLPFSTVSLFIYGQILLEIYRKRGCIVYDSFFFRMTCSQSLYDISFVIMYFVMELPQDWPSMYGFYFAMNDTIIPQLIYAHVFMCTIAQVRAPMCMAFQLPFLASLRKFGPTVSRKISLHLVIGRPLLLFLVGKEEEILGITMMAVSRMLFVCHPIHAITNMLKRMSLMQVIFIHCLVPAVYASYIVLFHGWRSYGYMSGSVSRNGNNASITINSHVLMALGLAGCITSAVCYVRISLTLRKRPMRAWRSEVYILVTSFVLFCALCAITAFFVANVIIRTAWRFSMAYYVLRNHSYAFTFLLSLSNPWCLMISSASMRSSVLRRCLPSCCARLPLCRSLYEKESQSTATSTITKPVTSAALPVISVTKI